MCKARLPFSLLSETFLTIRQNSLYVTVCMIVRTFYQGYFIHSLSTLYYYNAPSLTTRLTSDYRDRTCTGKCGPALLDTPHGKGHAAFNSLRVLKLNLPKLTSLDCYNIFSFKFSLNCLQFFRPSKALRTNVRAMKYVDCCGRASNCFNIQLLLNF